MFVPIVVLQAVLALLLAGCAAPRPAVPQAAPAPATGAPPSSSASGAGTPSYSDQPEAPVPAPAGFTDAQGRLLPEVQAYANQVAQEQHIPLAHVQALLSVARYNTRVAELMTPSGSRVRRSWTVYRARFVEPIRIRTGVQFWQAQREALDRTAAEQGVPPSILVAIIGVETVYGRHTGGFRVLDSLATLALRHPEPARPERVQMFRAQLADLIALDYQGRLDARSARGSYAGAMGLPQFMPGSLLRYAVDGDADGRIDLSGNPADAIASVAHFLRAHGWQPGLPVFAPVRLPSDASRLVHGGLEPTYDWAQLETSGVRPLDVRGPAPWMQYKLGVVDLVDESRGRAEYRLGTPNFFAITHYNRSYFYATSVADLAQELALRMGYGGPD